MAHEGGATSVGSLPMPATVHGATPPGATPLADQRNTARAVCSDTPRCDVCNKSLHALTTQRPVRLVRRLHAGARTIAREPRDARRN